MKVLFLVRSFNSLARRLFSELTERGHAVAVVCDPDAEGMIRAVAHHAPDLVLAPYLVRRIPEAVFERVPTLVVHPGPPGDRGPSSLDRAILGGRNDWGVTVLRAEAEYDAGPVFASRGFALEPYAKSIVYRTAFARAAVPAVLEAIERAAAGCEGTRPASSRFLPGLPLEARRVAWSADDTETVLRKIRASDGRPGAPGEVMGVPVRLYDAHPEEGPVGRASPGSVLARRHHAILVKTTDGAVWVTTLRADAPGRATFKRPAARLLGARLRGVPLRPPPRGADPRLGPWGAPPPGAPRTWREIEVEVARDVAWVAFEFYNGAFGVSQARRLRDAYRAAAAHARVVVLAGGRSFFSNGVHLAAIEAAPAPAEEAWRNIEAMNDLCLEILSDTDRITVAALRGGAAAGGCALALACDRVLGHAGTVLHPYYRHLGLPGAEYFSYVLPRRVGSETARCIEAALRPMGAAEAHRVGLLDEVLPEDPAAFRAEVLRRARELAEPSRFEAFVREKRARRARDEAARPLAAYRVEEMRRMRAVLFSPESAYRTAIRRFLRGGLPVGSDPFVSPFVSHS